MTDIELKCFQGLLAQAPEFLYVETEGCNSWQDLLRQLNNRLEDGGLALTKREYAKAVAYRTQVALSSVEFSLNGRRYGG